MAIYAIHPSGSTTALQLATSYGLTDPVEYIVIDDTNIPKTFHWHEYINLYPREDGHYASIKYELGDERDGVPRYQGGYLWKEVGTSEERMKADYKPSGLDIF